MADREKRLDNMVLMILLALLLLIIGVVLTVVVLGRYTIFSEIFYLYTLKY